MFGLKLKQYLVIFTHLKGLSLGLKKNIVCFRFPTDPIKTCATQIYFMDFLKNFFFFFFLGNP